MPPSTCHRQHTLFPSTEHCKNLHPSRKTFWRTYIYWTWYWSSLSYIASLKWLYRFGCISEPIELSYWVYIYYIWCVSKLGNIFKSPTGKKFFLRGHCDKSIEPYVKTKYVPERSCHMLARNTLKLIVFFFHWGVQNPSIWPIFKKCSKLVKLRGFLHINKKKNFLFLMYFWLACGKISQEHISILHKVQYFLHSDLSKISYFTVWDLKMLPSFETHHIYMVEKEKNKKETRPNGQ